MSNMLRFLTSKVLKPAYDPYNPTQEPEVKDGDWRIEIANGYGQSLVVAEGPKSVAIQRLQYIISDAQEAIYIINNEHKRDTKTKETV